MGFFDFIGDAASAVGSVAGAITGAAASVVNSDIGQTLLTGVGTAFGDPSLGQQAKSAVSVATGFEKMLGIGVNNSKPSASTFTVPRSNAAVATSRYQAPLFNVVLQGHRLHLTKQQLLVVLTAMHRKGASLASPPPPPLRIPSASPPPPAPPPVPIAAPKDVAALLAIPPGTDLSNTSITLPSGRTVGPGQPLNLPPVMASVAQDIASATGLNVGTSLDNGPPNVVRSSGPGGHFSRDL